MYSCSLCPYIMQIYIYIYIYSNLEFSCSPQREIQQKKTTVKTKYESWRYQKMYKCLKKEMYRKRAKETSEGGRDQQGRYMPVFLFLSCLLPSDLFERERDRKEPTDQHPSGLILEMIKAMTSKGEEIERGTEVKTEREAKRYTNKHKKYPIIY